MHILIDVQGYQSESKFRGIGRSTLAMSRAIIKNAKHHRVSILLNGMFPLSNVSDLKNCYKDILPEEEMFIFSGHGPVAYRERNNHARTQAAHLCREAAIANINPDIVFVISFFEGYDDDYVVSIPDRPVPWRTVCVCHDLIPLINKERYLGDPNYNEFYMNKLHSYETADAIFAISDSAREEVIKYTNIPAERIVNISSAVGGEFCINEYSEEDIASLRIRYNLPSEFILTLAMIEPRKNVEALIHAYSQLPGALQDKYPLVLAYKVRAEELDRIIALAESYGLKREQLIFTGFLPDADLIALYNICKLFVFPSLHEGFGLPPLEAMKCGAATLASNVTSLPEVMGWEGAMFDPYNVDDIRKSIERVLTDDAFYDELKKHAAAQAEKFSWDNTAKAALETFTSLISCPQKEIHYDLEGYISTSIERIRNIRQLTTHDKLGNAWALAKNNFSRHQRKIMVDISVLVQHDAKTGIQRVSRSILYELLKNGVAGYEIRAVYFTQGECYRYANKFVKEHFGYDFGTDEPVLFTKGDILLVTDLTAHLFPELNVHLDSLRRAGAQAHFVIHDILPLRNPEWSIVDIQRAFPIWLKGIAEYADGVVCVSASVADDVRHWLKKNADEITINPALTIKNFHLGADLEASVPSKGLPANGEKLLKMMSSSPSFIMVGTMEPRKGHVQVLDAFERLWAKGEDINLFIVGKQGWNVDALCERMRNHPQKDKHLFWLHDISDEFLGKLYQQAKALIFASLGEGFGLPLIEAAQKGLPVIIRDIPVFREIAQDGAYYFTGECAEDIEQAISTWLEIYEAGTYPKSENIKWLTWEQSTALLLKQLPIIKHKV
ncbi:D-inositol-3-phosphate glycosyltransferase [Serratia ficaria]|uniref:glycosyltransferase family 4 protein n=1 Tax=Serratia ficaria TaxID=61651 RepID=UPI0021834C54|nr:glycosyltransferase family 1 protein [Serratia ficaria]CAI2401172.1 D-inositol-3-phosphate glycosyltransferase [Serratia ficaria]